MKDALQYALLAVGAFLLARQFGLLPEISLGAIDAGNSGGSTHSGGRHNTAEAAKAHRAKIVEDLSTVAGSNALNYDQWGTLYRQLTNIAAPGPASVGIERKNPMPAMTADAFVSAIGV